MQVFGTAKGFWDILFLNGIRPLTAQDCSGYYQPVANARGMVRFRFTAFRFTHHDESLFGRSLCRKRLPLIETL